MQRAVGAAVVLFLLVPVFGADETVEIIGQKSWSTRPGQADSIQLSDLEVLAGERGYTKGLASFFFKDDYAESITAGSQENEPPVITGQVSLSINEGESITIHFAHLTVSDPDNTYPDDFTLKVSEGSNYSLSGTTVTPSAGFSGTLTVPVTVNDGTIDSQPFDLKIEVTPAPPQNVPPVITGQVSLSIREGESITIQLAHLTVTDPDNTWPDDFTLNVAAGSNYSLNGTTVTPSAGFVGTLTVPVRVNDGTDDSAPFDLKIEVVQAPAENVPPVITGQASLSTTEGTAITITLSHLTVTDPDNSYPADFTLKVSDGSNYSVSGTTVTPNAGFVGTLTVPVRVNDGTDDSELFNLKIEVTEAPSENVPPVITGQVSLSTAEGKAITIQLSHLTVTDPDDAYPNGFTLKVSEGSNYSLSGTTVTPHAGFVGTLTVKVVVNDGTDDSEPFDLKIEVTPASADPPPSNVPPVIMAQVRLSITEGMPLVISLAHLTVTDPDNAYPNDFTLQVLAGVNYTVNGSTITPASGFVGILVVQVKVNDGTQDSAPFNLQITVTPRENQKPVITGHSGISILKNTSVEITLLHVTVHDPDNTYPGDFVLMVLGGSNYSVSGNVVTPAHEFTGTLSVSVMVNDGQSNSDPFVINIQVTEGSVLVILGQAPLETLEDSTFTLRPEHLIVNDPSNKYPNGYTLNVSTGENYSVQGTTIIPEKDFNGNLKVKVTIGNGEHTSEPFDLLLVVKPVNDAPRFSVFDSRPIPFNVVDDIIFVAKEAVIEDPDDDRLIVAEIRFNPEQFQQGIDELVFEPRSNILGVFDNSAGVLSLIGFASLNDYQETIRSIQYRNNRPDSLPLAQIKTLYFQLHDGKDSSELYQKEIVFQDVVELDIPTAFTPNGDNANDMWRIIPLTGSTAFDEALIRVYDKRGKLLYESLGFDRPWDGKFNGEPLPVDTYYYTIKLNRKNLRGVVTILR